MLPKSCRIQQNITTMCSDASRCLGSKIDRTSTNNIYRSSIVHLSNIYRTSIEHLSSIYWNAKSRSGKNKTAAQGRPNWRHVAEEKLERQRQEELQTQLWQWEEEQAQEKRGIVWNLFLAAWQGCAEGDDIVRCWETAKRRFPINPR